ncbi:hypothetical protein QFZ55_004214 [Streptomyces luteogriseus]|nr:hypothetical protein [Streptomyces luteogriseus]
MHPQTAYRWFREGMLPVPAQRVGPRTILVNIDANTTPGAIGGLGLYARVSSHDQRPPPHPRTTDTIRAAGRDEYAGDQDIHNRDVRSDQEWVQDSLLLTG